MRWTVHSVHQSCVGLWGFAWILQLVLTECRNHCSTSLGCGSHSVETEHCCARLQMGRRRSRHQLSPYLSCVLLLQLFEHLVHFRIGPFTSSHLDVCEGRFRWGADVLVSSLLDVLSSRRSALTFVAFVDLQKAFDAAWVEGTLVRIHEVGVTRQMWSSWCISFGSMARQWDRPKESSLTLALFF